MDVLAAHEEIKGAIEYHHDEGLVEDRDRRMLGGVLDLSDMDVTQIMVHRKNIVMLDADLPARDLVAEALERDRPDLSAHRYGIIALGDMTYQDTFCGGGKKVDEALKRIDDGTFGVCRVCGNPVGADRLEALPWATLCIEDKRKQERG